MTPTFQDEVQLAGWSETHTGGAKVTQARLQEVLSYDAWTGRFEWRVARGNQPAGAEAGKPHPKGYWQIRVDGVLYLAHRLAWLYVNGEWPAEEIDHKNRVRNDNRFDNLRAASRSTQNHNRAPAVRELPPGVSLHSTTGKPRARIYAGGREKHLGYFDSTEMAAEAYASAKRIEVSK